MNKNTLKKQNKIKYLQMLIGKLQQSSYAQEYQTIIDRQYLLLIKQLKKVQY